MQTTTLSSKGQLVIPKQVRDAAHLAAGDELAVRWVDGEIRLTPIAHDKPVPLSDVAGCLSRPGRKALTEQQTLALIAQRLKAKNSAA